MFVLFDSPKCPRSFCEYLSSKHQTINFSTEHKNIGSLSILDVKICCKSEKFLSSIYRKPNVSAVFTSYEGFIPRYQKRQPLYTLLHTNLAYVVISRHINWKTIIRGLSSGKTIIHQILLICLLNQFLITSIHLTLLFRMYLNKILLLWNHISISIIYFHFYMF